MSTIQGNRLKLSVFGESHGASVGMTLEGVPAGLQVDPEALQSFLSRRAPGRDPWSTPRKEPDIPEFLSGILDGRTTGAPITAVIPNTNTRSGDYANLKNCPRPGHADYTAQIKYGGSQDAAGGGHFSGRLTAPLCIAGGLCLQWLKASDIHIGAHILTVAHISDTPFNPCHPQLDRVGQIFPTLTAQSADAMKTLISQTYSLGDSVGGSVECAVTGLPAGLGGPLFDGLEGKLSQLLFGIPAVKGVEFGQTQPYGSENNDAYTLENGRIKTVTNHCGGILGGISNGMPLIFRVHIKPTPSIARPQQSVDLSTMSVTTLCIQGRHDPCIVPRAVPVVEAAAAIALFDLLI